MWFYSRKKKYYDSNILTTLSQQRSDEMHTVCQHHCASELGVPDRRQSHLGEQDSKHKGSPSKEITF